MNTDPPSRRRVDVPSLVLWVLAAVILTLSWVIWRSGKRPSRSHYVPIGVESTNAVVDTEGTEQSGWEPAAASPGASGQPSRSRRTHHAAPAVVAARPVPAPASSTPAADQPRIEAIAGKVELASEEEEPAPQQEDLASPYPLRDDVESPYAEQIEDQESPYAGRLHGLTRRQSSSPTTTWRP